MSFFVYVCPFYSVRLSLVTLPLLLALIPPSPPPPPTTSPPQVKFNPGRSDNMIIQSIALLDQLDKDLNTFAMRVREWYCWHFPELRDLVKDNYVFARCAAYVQDRTTLTEEKMEGLTEITLDEELSQGILTAAKTSMGMDTSAFDMGNIVAFTTRMVKLAEYRKQLHAYLLEKMATVAPNLGTKTLPPSLPPPLSFLVCLCVM